MAFHLIVLENNNVASATQSNIQLYFFPFVRRRRYGLEP
jgi:hypothetical protein